MTSVKKVAAMGLTLTMVVGMLPAAAFAYSSKDGWVEKDGKLYFYEDGRKIKCDVRYDPSDDNNYLLNESGVRVTKKGWTTLDYYYTYYGTKIKQSQRYYLAEGGVVKASGWKKIKGKYYYFVDGHAQTNTLILDYDDNYDIKSAYAVDKKGARITKKGWYRLKGTSYDFYSGAAYKYDEWVYVKTGGKLVRGCVKKIGKKKYVFSEYGLMARNSYACSTDGKTYYLADKNGVQVTKKGWHKFSYSEKYTSTGYKYYDKSTYWVYVKKDGTLQTGLKKIKGTYYYFNPTMRCNNTFTKEGKEYDTKYYFGRDGKCKKTSKIYHSVT